MGIKENFSQAVRELTGNNKEEKKPESKGSVDELRRAVDDEQPEPEKVYTPEAEYAEDKNVGEEAGTAANSFGDDRDEEFSKPYTPQPTYTQPQQSYAQPQPSYSQAQPSYSQPQQDSYNRPQQNSYQPQNEFNQHETVSYSTNAYAQTSADDNELTVISKNTVIDGNVRSFANMNIDGNIKGDVETTKNINLNGKIVGNIAGNNANLLTSQVQGNIRMKGRISMERDTLLIGDVGATYANINGKIKGNLDIGGKAELKSDAVVFGDISASTITVNDGAIIQGYVSTTFLNKDESKNIFPDAITINE